MTGSVASMREPRHRRCGARDSAPSNGGDAAVAARRRGADSAELLAAPTCYDTLVYCGRPPDALVRSSSRSYERCDRLTRPRSFAVDAEEDVLVSTVEPILLSGDQGEVNRIDDLLNVF